MIVAGMISFPVTPTTTPTNAVEKENALTESTRLNAKKVQMCQPFPRCLIWPP